MTLVTDAATEAAATYSQARLGLYIDGEWREGAAGRSFECFNPATDEVIGHVARAETSDLDDALAAAERAFPLWRDTSAFEKSRILLKAAALLRERAPEIGRLMAIEQGKPLKDAVLEVQRVSGTLDGAPQETRRLYGRIIPTDVDTVADRALRAGRRRRRDRAVELPGRLADAQDVRGDRGGLLARHQGLQEIPGDGVRAGAGASHDAGLPDGRAQPGLRRAAPRRPST